MKKPALVIALAASLLILAGGAYFLHAAKSAPEETAAAVTAPEAPATATVQSAAATADPAAFRAAADLAQSGVNPIPFRDEPAEAMKQKYDFIADILSPLSPDGFEMENPLPSPATVKIAEISMPAKKLDFVAVMVDDPAYCRDAGCHFEIHVRRGDKWPQMIGTTATADSYYDLDDNSVSFIFCDKGAYRRWRMMDGALDRPLPIDAPGYFAAEGIVTDSHIKGTCPGAPEETGVP